MVPSRLFTRPRGLAGALVLLALLTACPRASERPPEDAFSLSASPGVLRLAPGEAGGGYLTLLRSEGFHDPVEITVLGLEGAQGVSVTVGPNPVYGEHTALAFSLDESTIPQRLELSVLARSRLLEETIPLTLVVAPHEEGSAAVSGRLTTANAAIRIEPVGAAPAGQDNDMNARTAEQAVAEQDVSEQATEQVYVAGELLVQYEIEGDEGALGPAALEHYALAAQAVGESFELEPLRVGDPGRPDLVRVPAGEDPEAFARRLSRDPRVRYAEPNYLLSTASLPSASLSTASLPDDPRLNEQWAAAAAGLPVAWAKETGRGAGVIIAVIDSGFDLQHEDLAPRFLPGYDFCNQLSGTCSQAGTPTNDDPSFGSFGNAHGSHVAGLVGALGGNALGVAGAAHGENIRLLPIKIFNGSGGGATTSSFIDGIRWAVGVSVTTTDGKRTRNPNPAHVINLSLGMDRPSSAMQDAINEARRRGAVVVAATGNAGADRVWSPAAADGVIGVGSHNGSFARSCFSNYGLPGGPNGPGGVDLLAGGGESCGLRQPVLSTVPRDAYGYLVGTSMAAPLVSGAAALLLSQHPELTAQEVEARLLGTAYFDPAWMSAAEYGAGILRADRALGLAGPGDPVIIRSAPNERTDVAVLDLYGGSSPYKLSNLPAGELALQAGQRLPGTLGGEGRVTLEETGSGEVDIPLTYQP